jgi:hypothetical protein
MYKIKSVFLALCFIFSYASAQPKLHRLDPCSKFANTSHLLQLRMGDTSCDGHCLKEEVLVCSSIPQNEIYKLFKKGESILGFDIESQVEEYEDSTIKAGHLKKLHSLGVPMLFNDEIEYSEKEFLELSDKVEVAIGTQQYLYIFLGLVKVAQKDFEYHLFELGRGIDIGGYGLFFH